MQKTARSKSLSSARDNGLTTLAGQAHARLKDSIIAAKYLPGQFLQESGLCADLGLGRTPVRQALHRLQQEGLVEVIHRKGIIVRSDSLPELLLALDARILVEPFCAARCAERAKTSDIMRLDDLHRDYMHKSGTGDRHTLMDIDRQIHQLIGSIAGNRLLIELLRPIQDRMMRLWFLPHWQIDDFGETASEHEAMLAAIRAHQPSAASLAMRHHLLSLKQRMISGNAVYPYGESG